LLGSPWTHSAGRAADTRSVDGDRREHDIRNIPEVAEDEHAAHRDALGEENVDG